MKIKISSIFGIIGVLIIFCILVESPIIGAITGAMTGAIVGVNIASKQIGFIGLGLIIVSIVLKKYKL